jgi:prenyltransferase beta subunit
MELMIEAHVNYLIDLLKKSLQSREEKRDEKRKNRLTQAQRVFDVSLEAVCLQVQNYEHEDLLLCGIYWILSSLCILFLNPTVTYRIKKVLCDTSSALERIVLSCFIPTIGGFSSTTEHNDPDTILSTMYAVQCLTLLKYDMTLQRNNIITYICSLQNRETGAFYVSSAPWMQLECDLRASLCALVTLEHLDALHECCFQTTASASTSIDIELLTEWICASQNDDGGFGCSPGNESHAGFTYCAIASLVLLKKISFFSQYADRLEKLCW